MYSPTDLSHSALLIVDNQVAFVASTSWGPQRSNPRYEANISRLLAAFRAPGKPWEKPLVVHVRHVSTDDWPNSPLHHSRTANLAFQDNSTPLADGSEPVITKHVNSSFIGTDLETLLKERKIYRLFICGLSTDHCVNTTTRMAANLHVTDHVNESDGERVKGEVVLVDDATAAWRKPAGKWDAEIVHAVSVESLREFASIMTTEDVLTCFGG